jgi:hypothetical protein
VLTIGGSEHIGVPKQVIHWPYFIHPNPAKPELTGILDSASASTSFPDNQKNRSIDVSMIVSNKVAWAVPSNYGLRRRLTLKALEHNLRVFGMGWQETRISKLRANLRMYTFFLSQGKIIHPQHIFENLYFSKLENVYSVADKFDILRESLYHLVIENSSTYVSEKLLDAFIGGAIPIYIGPDLSQYGIPSDCVVTPKGGIDGIIKVLQNLSGYDSTEMKRNITKFMNSEHALSPWKPTMVAKSIIRLCQ